MVTLEPNETARGAAHRWGTDVIKSLVHIPGTPPAAYVVRT